MTGREMTKRDRRAGACMLLSSAASRGYFLKSGVAVLVLASCAGGTVAQVPAGSASTSGSSPASGVPASPCKIIDAQSDRAGTTPSLYAVCGGASLRIGDAAGFSVAENTVLGTTLVVRQNNGSTAVEIAWVGSDGAIQLEDLTGELVDKLAKAGQGRSRSFAVNLTRYAADGSAAVAVAGETALPFSVDLSRYGRAAAVATAAPAGG